MAVELRYANLTEYQRISAFVDEHWAKGHVYTHERRLFDWTFRRPGQWNVETYSIALAEDEGDLVGILGGIPFRFNRFGEDSRGVWIVNYVIRADHRRGATALRLLSQFRRPEFAAVIAFGINPATATIYRVLHGQVLPEIPRHFAVLPGRTVRAARLLQLTWPEWEADRARQLASDFELPKLPASPAQPPGNSVPSDWDRRDWPDWASRTSGAARDADYLRWRYLDHPCFDYRFVTVPEGARTGLAVWRLEAIRADGTTGRVEVDRIGRLVEFLPASRSNAETLLAAFLGQVAACDGMAADYYGYHGETRRWLEELGFPGTGFHQDGNALPSRFQPLDRKGGGIMSAMFVHDCSPPCPDDPECPWYWTKSDSDQDRPN